MRWPVARGRAARWLERVAIKIGTTTDELLRQHVFVAFQALAAALYSDAALWPVDETMAPVLQPCEDMGLGVYAPTLVSDHRDRKPKNWGDKVGWITHLALADHVIWFPKSAEIVRRMYCMMVQACDR